MPFSGKTTLGRTIAEYLDCPCISLDEINEARGLSGGDGIPVEEWEKTHFLAMQQLEIFMQSPGNIVLDDTNCFRWLRDRFRDLAAEHNYQTTIVFLDVSLAEIRHRMQINEQTKIRHQVRADIIDEMAKTFELPQEDEKAIRYSGELAIEEWIIKAL